MLCREKNWYSLGFFKLAITTKSSLKSYTCGCIMGNLEVLGLLGSVTECWTATAWKCCLEWQLWGGLCHRGCATLSWDALVLQQHQGCVKHSTQMGFSGFSGCWQELERPESLHFLTGHHLSGKFPVGSGAISAASRATGFLFRRNIQILTLHLAGSL